MVVRRRHPAADYDVLYKAGAAAIFGPGTNIPEAARARTVLAVSARLTGPDHATDRRIDGPDAVADTSDELIAGIRAGDRRRWRRPSP